MVQAPEMYVYIYIQLLFDYLNNYISNEIRNAEPGKEFLIPGNSQNIAIKGGVKFSQAIGYVLILLYGE